MNTTSHTSASKTEQSEQIGFLTNRLTRNILDAAQAAMGERAFQRYRKMVFRIVYYDFQTELLRSLQLPQPKRRGKTNGTDDNR